MSTESSNFGTHHTPSASLASSIPFTPTPITTSQSSTPSPTGIRVSTNLRANCPATGGDANLEPLDLVTPNSFDNNYFSNLAQRRGLLISDQTLFNGGSADSIVQGYIDNPASFASDFAAAMVAMGDIDPLTGTAGVIRTVCNTAT
ncbi:hypothetical protein L6452_20637 [Arctium lappa]|uniref:Uncharacterized protein n=1 Tax=Arctium lappa TaxID=4217 RepID=A0ACB9BDT6_ARCLA|nr:hypothetical protein L6452_20637 [Arctium lappa]